MWPGVRRELSVVVETSLTVRPIGIMNRFVETYASDVLPLHAKHGFDLLGGWSRAGGTGQQVVHLHRFDDLAAYERARASIAGDAAVAAMVEDHAREVSVTESIVLGETTAYATDARLKQGRVREGDAPLTYIQRVSRARFPHRPEVARLLARIVDAVEASNAISLVTAYQAVTGRTSDVTDLFVLPKGEGALPEANADERALEGGVVAERFHALLEDEIVYRLRPLPYSPLQ